MSGVCFYFEENDVDVWSGRRIDLDAWNYAFKMAGDIDKVVVVNRTKQRLTTIDASLDFKVLGYLPLFEGSVTHIICPWDEAEIKQDLWSFSHRTDWYLFGPARGWKKRVKNGVFIPQASTAALHSVHAASIVMAHRYKVTAWQ